MIRTALVLVLVVASTSFAQANVPPAGRTAVAVETSATAACTSLATRLGLCGERTVTRGHADLAPRHVVPANAEAVATA